MFYLRHTVKKRHLVMAWEPGLFAFMGFLCIWGALVALHRLLAWGGDADMALVGMSIGTLWVAGVAMLVGTAGLVFVPDKRKWGRFLGFVEPLVAWWHRLGDGDRIELSVHDDAGPSFELAIAGGERKVLGRTPDSLVAASCAESLAAYLGRPLVWNEGATEKRAERGPVWGALGGLLDLETASKRKFTGSECALPWRVFALRGRGPFLLAVFMLVAVGLNWESLALTRSMWGIASIAVLAGFCAWAFPVSADAFAQRGVVRAEKEGLVVELKGLWRTRRTFAWNALAYLAVLPARKGFLSLAGRECRIVVGDADCALEVGETLPEEDLVELYRFLVTQAKKYAR